MVFISPIECENSPYPKSEDSQKSIAISTSVHVHSALTTTKDSVKVSVQSEMATPLVIS